MNDHQQAPLAEPIKGRSPKLRNALGILIFAGFVVFIELYFGWTKLLAPWASLSPALVVGAMAVVFISYVLRALRVYHYFRGEMGGAFVLCMKLFLQHNVLNNLLPMRSGEISFPVLMSRYFRVAPVRSVPALLWFRLLDLHSLLVIAVVVSAGTPPRPILVAAALLWMSVPYLAYLLGGRFLRYLEAHPGGRLRSLFTKALASLPQSPRVFWVTWGWTLLNWLVKLGVYTWVLLLFLDVSAMGAWLGVIAGDLTSVLPIHSVAGLGTYEAGVVAALLPFGIGPESALQAAVNLHLFMLGCAAIGGGLSFLLPAKRPGSTAERV